MTPSPPRAVHAAALFQWLRWRQFINSFRLLWGASAIRVLSIVLCCVLIWGTLFVVSFIGFRALEMEWELAIGGHLISLFLNMSFIVLSVLLIFSTGIILYSSLFNSRECHFLLTCPVPSDQIFTYKYQGAVGFSSWGFVLLGSPVLLAYGLNIDSTPWYFYALLPLFFFGFVILPGSLGALLCLLMVNFFPRRQKQFFIGFVLILLALGSWWVYARLLPTAQRVMGMSDAVSDFLGEFSLFQSPFLPAYWMAEGLRAAALNETVRSLYYLTLIWSNGLLVYVLLAWAGRLLYRRGFNLVASGSGGRRRYGASVLDWLLAGVLWFLDRKTRLLVSKDFRTFRRDPAQWAQVLIFVGLAVLYFLTIRSFYRQQIGQKFQNGISLLNLTATSFLICAYTGRFIFPMLSLEGRKFWILGLLPLDRSRLVWSKFAFAAAGTVLWGAFLVIFSDLMMGVAWPLLVLHAVAITALALGLSGMSVGMGTTMPNFRETDPSKIAVGFGGTLNLVMGLLYQVVVLGIMVLPWHLVLAFSDAQDLSVVYSQWWLWLGTGVGLLFAILGVVLPLRAANRAIERMEF